MNQHIANHAQRGLVDVLYVIIERMPHLGEAFIAAFGVQIDDH